MFGILPDGSKIEKFPIEVFEVPAPRVPASEVDEKL